MDKSAKFAGDMQSWPRSDLPLSDQCRPRKRMPSFGKRETWCLLRRFFYRPERTTSIVKLQTERFGAIDRCRKRCVVRRLRKIQDCWLNESRTRYNYLACDI